MAQTMVDKLRLIADAIEQGKVIEVKVPKMQWDASEFNKAHERAQCTVWGDYEYRIAPDKPRTFNQCIENETCGENVHCVELTDEVRSALESAGIEI